MCPGRSCLPLHGEPKVKVTRRSVCLPQQVAFTLGSASATIAVQGYMRAEKAWPVCDHCAKERPQPRDAHLTEHPFPAQSDPQVALRVLSTGGTTDLTAANQPPN